MLPPIFQIGKKVLVSDGYVEGHKPFHGTIAEICDEWICVKDNSLKGVWWLNANAWIFHFE